MLLVLPAARTRVQLREAEAEQVRALGDQRTFLGTQQVGAAARSSAKRPALPGSVAPHRPSKLALTHAESFLFGMTSVGLTVASEKLGSEFSTGRFTRYSEAGKTVQDAF